jgi:hypothetical protein
MNELSGWFVLCSLFGLVSFQHLFNDYTAIGGRLASGFHVGLFFASNGCFFGGCLIFIFFSGGLFYC